VSLCESDLSNLNREQIGHTIPLRQMTWSQRCPKVAFDGTTIADYSSYSVSPSSANPLKLTVNNPDQAVLWPGGPKDDVVPAMNQNLKLVRLQYRPVGVGEWITAKSEDSEENDKKKNLLCGDSRTEGCKFEWDVNNQFEKLLSGFKDGVYELRVKNFCFGGHTLAESSVHEYVSEQRLSLTVDTFKPIPQSLVRVDNHYTWSFYEPIDCSNQKVTITRTSKLLCDDEGNATPDESYEPTALTPEEALEFNIKCHSVKYAVGGAGFWSIEMPLVHASATLSPKQACERRCALDGPYRVAITGISDESGNEVKEFIVAHDSSCATSATSSVAAVGRTRVEINHPKRRAPTPSSALSASRTNVAFDAIRRAPFGIEFILGVACALGVFLVHDRRRRFARSRDDDAYASEPLNVAAQPAKTSAVVANYGAAV